MPISASAKFSLRPAISALPFGAALILTGAGITSFATPVGRPKQPLADPMPGRQPAATAGAAVRLTLPRPVSAAPDANRAGPGIVRVSLIAPRVSLRPIHAHTHPQILRIALPPVRPDDRPSPVPADAHATLAASRGAGEAPLSSVPHDPAGDTLGATTVKRPIPMVDDETRASLALVLPPAPLEPGAADRTAALAPAPSAPEPSQQVGLDTPGLAPESAPPSAGQQQILAEMSDLPARARKSGLGASVPGPAERGIRQYRHANDGISFEVVALVGGSPAGSVSIRIDGGRGFSVRLLDLLALLRPAIDAEAYQRLSSSAAAQEFVGFAQLRAAGIPVRFNDDDQLVLAGR